MQQFGEMIQPYLTTEVVTVLVAMGVAWLGYKAACKVGSVAKDFTSKASFTGLTAAALTIMGLGGIGAGTGELMSRSGNDEPIISQPETQLTNTELVGLATNCSVDDDNLKQILEYAQRRDTQARIQPALIPVRYGQGRIVLIEAPQSASEEARVIFASDNQRPQDLPFEITSLDEMAAIRNDESMMTFPMAWTAIGLGIAALVCAGGAVMREKVA